MLTGHRFLQSSHLCCCPGELSSRLVTHRLHFFQHSFLGHHVHEMFTGGACCTCMASRLSAFPVPFELCHGCFCDVRSSVGGAFPAPSSRVWPTPLPTFPGCPHPWRADSSRPIPEGTQQLQRRQVVVTGTPLLLSLNLTSWSWKRLLASSNRVGPDSQSHLFAPLQSPGTLAGLRSPVASRSVCSPGTQIT